MKFTLIQEEELPRLCLFGMNIELFVLKLYSALSPIEMIEMN